MAVLIYDFLITYSYDLWQGYLFLNCCAQIKVNTALTWFIFPWDDSTISLSFFFLFQSDGIKGKFVGRIDD